MKIRSTYLLLVCLVFTGCLEITEEITVRKDQSGNIQYSLGIPNAGSLFDIVNVNAFVLTDDVKENIENFTSVLKKQEGIYNVQTTFDGHNDQLLISFDFKNTRYLKKAIYNTFGYKKNFLYPTPLKVSNHKVRRMNYSPWVKRYMKIKRPEFLGIDVIGWSNFSSIVHLPNPIKKEPKKAKKISKDRKSVRFRFSVDEILKNEVNTKIKIKY